MYHRALSVETVELGKNGVLMSIAFVNGTNESDILHWHLKISEHKLTEFVYFSLWQWLVKLYRSIKQNLTYESFYSSLFSLVLCDNGERSPTIGT